jgi:uncharacterized protein (TIGR02246 family)
MRRIALAILLCAGLGACSDSRAGRDRSADKAAIQALLDAHGEAWTKGDAAAAAAVMTQDADWVGGDGGIYEGRAAIEAAHREWLSGSAKGSRHLHPGIPAIRFLRPDVALVDGDSYISGAHDDHGQELPAQTSRYTAVMVKENGQWLVAAFRSMPQLKSEIKPADVH